MNKSDSSVSSAEFLSGGGEMGALIRTYDWGKTPLGSSRFWPQSLRTAISIMLETHFPMYIAWGKDFIQFYNDGYRPILGATKHPALGKKANDTFEEIWDIIGPMFEGVMLGKAVGLTDFLLPLNRYGYTEECYFIFSYSPIRDESSSVGGVLVTVTETTTRVIEERRLKTLRYMAKRAAEVKTAQQAWNKIKLTLEVNDFDIPFGLCYQLDEAGQTATLMGNVNLINRPEVPDSFRVDSHTASWLSRKTFKSKIPELIPNLQHHLPGLVCGAWAEPVKMAYQVPLLRPGKKNPYGVLVLGVNPRKAFDESYKTFFDLFGNHAARAISNGYSFEEERKRADALLEIDKAKTTFFNNISHEFRTPLTLILGPLEDLLNSPPDSLPADSRKSLVTTHRNALRLLRMVNNLLDFSRIEAGRTTVQYQATEIATYTGEIASSFRSAIEKAGLKLNLHCSPLKEVVFVDREMWEKIILNLLSNAFKYTLQGEISVSVSAENGEVVVKVSDTGVGIPQRELAHVFDRFHRVKSAEGRSFEGTGIGLSLVNELIKLHMGTIAVQSAEGVGSVFTLRLPVGKGHLPASQIAEPHREITPDIAKAYLHEAEALLGPSGATQKSGDSRRLHGNRKNRVLIADDNADMRKYLQSLLDKYFQVEAVSNGQEALTAIYRNPPDLVLSDIMMPVMDGVQLLKKMKADPGKARIPIVLLSARAGEEARIEGYDLGADDYLVKPFSARELLARVRSQLKIVNSHKHAEQQLSNLFLQAPVAISILRGPEYVIELANKKMVELWGKKPADILRRPVFEAMPELKGQGFEELLGRIYARGHRFAAQELPLLIKRNGMQEEVIYVKFVYEPLREEDGTISGIMVLADEVTELVNSRKKIEEYDRQLRNIIRQAPVAMAIYRGPSFVIEVANDKALEFWGHTAEEVLNKPLLEAMPELHHQGIEPLLSQAFATGRGFYTNELLINLQRGGTLTETYVSFALEPIRNFDGAVISVMMLANDITELVLARKKIEESEARQKLAIEAAEMGTFDLNLVSGEFIYTERMAKLFGLMNSNVSSQVFRERIHPDDEHIRKKAMDEAWETGNLSYEARVIWPDKTAHWVKIKGKVIFDEHNYPLRMHGIAMDVTERKMLEQQKDDFMGIVSHELKTPVTSMKGYIQMLEEEFSRKGETESAHHLSKVDIQIDKLSNLINDLLDVTKIEAGKMEFNYEEFDLAQLVDEVVSSMQFIAARHRLIRTGASKCRVLGDRNRLEQVIINLISNATKYSPKADKVVINTSIEGGNVTVSVQDFGTGISSTELNRIFDRFYRVNNLQYKSGGLGLGLYISAEIIKRQGGKIWVESELGRGSVFYFSLSCLN